MSELAQKLIADYKNNPKKYNKRLEIGRCGLTKLPIELFDLKDLEELIVSNQYWKEGFDKEIESKNTGEYNYLSDIPIAFKELSLLKKLILLGERNKDWAISK